MGNPRGRRLFKHEKPGEEAPGSREDPPRWEIMYRFYKKEVSNPLTILRRSAMPEATKVDTFSSEIIRRMKTTHLRESREVREGILLDLKDEPKIHGLSTGVEIEGAQGCINWVHENSPEGNYGRQT